jgi:hypothetical protein
MPLHAVDAEFKAWKDNLTKMNLTNQLFQWGCRLYKSIGTINANGGNLNVEEAETIMEYIEEFKVVREEDEQYRKRKSLGITEEECLHDILSNLELSDDTKDAIVNVMFEWDRLKTLMTQQDAPTSVKTMIDKIYRKKQLIYHDTGIDIMENYSLYQIFVETMQYLTERANTLNAWATSVSMKEASYYSFITKDEWTKIIKSCIPDENELPKIIKRLYERKKDKIIDEIFNPNKCLIKPTQLKRKFQKGLENALMEDGWNEEEIQVVKQNKLHISKEAIILLSKHTEKQIKTWAEAAGQVAMTRAKTRDEHIFMKGNDDTFTKVSYPIVKPKDLITAYNIRKGPNFTMGDASSEYYKVSTLNEEMSTRHNN